MNQDLMKQLKTQATTDILGVPILDADQLTRLVVQECADILMAQDVDPAFKSRMVWSLHSHFGLDQKR
jgi:hypothetical protein